MVMRPWQKIRVRDAWIAHLGITKIFQEKPGAKRVAMALLPLPHQNAKIGLHAI